MKRYTQTAKRYTQIGTQEPKTVNVYRLCTDCVPFETNRYTVKRLVKRLCVPCDRFFDLLLKKKKKIYIYRGIGKNRETVHKPPRRILRPVKGFSMCIYDELPDGGYLVACNGFVVDEDFVTQHARGVFEFCPWCGCLIVQRDLDMQERQAYADSVNAYVDARGEADGW